MAFVFTVNSYSMPLVFKVTKEIKTRNEFNFEEIAAFDSSKYKQLRISVLPVRNTDYADLFVKIEAVEDSDFLLLERFDFSSAFPSKSISVDNAPAKIRVSANVSGAYKVFIWGIQ